MTACGGARPDHAPPPVVAAKAAPPAAIAASLPDTGPRLDEGPARRILAERFRAAGLRIFVDEPVTAAGAALTVDGFDRERRIGYEYVAEGEVGLDLDARERAALSRLADPAILVGDAGSEEAIAWAADAVLAGLPSPSTPPSP